MSHFYLFFPDRQDVFIVDNGEAGIWVWCGRRASKQEKREGMANASAFIQQRNYSNNVQMVKVHESAETTEFKALFKVWEKEKVPGGKAYQHNKIGACHEYMYVCLCFPNSFHLLF